MAECNSVWNICSHKRYNGLVYHAWSNKRFWMKCYTYHCHIAVDNLCTYNITWYVWLWPGYNWTIPGGGRGGNIYGKLAFMFLIWSSLGLFTSLVKICWLHYVSWTCTHCQVTIWHTICMGYVVSWFVFPKSSKDTSTMCVGKSQYLRSLFYLSNPKFQVPVNNNNHEIMIVYIIVYSETWSPTTIMQSKINSTSNS